MGMKDEAFIRLGVSISELRKPEGILVQTPEADDLTGTIVLRCICVRRPLGLEMETTPAAAGRSAKNTKPSRTKGDTKELARRDFVSTELVVLETEATRVTGHVGHVPPLP